MTKQYDWEQIKVEYIEGNALNAISRKHGCNRAAIRKHAENGDWQRPGPSDKYKSTILSKATHKEMLEFNQAYKQCHEERMRGRNYYKYYLRTNPKVKELKRQIQSLKRTLKNINTEKTTFLSSCIKTVASLKSSF